MSQAAIRLRSLMESLSGVERRLAEYILANQGRVPFLSVYQIAAAGGCSVASVSRLVRKLGYAGLREFKVELARSLGSEASYFYQEIRPEDSDADLAAKVFSGNIRSLEDTLRMLEVDTLRRAADRLASARRLYFFGVGGSGFLARDAGMRFSFLGFCSQGFSDPNEIFFHAVQAARGDVAVGISHSGRTAVTVEALRLAAEKGAATIGVSNYLGSPLHRRSAHFFCTSFPESSVRIAALSSRLAQMCLLDTLYLLCARIKGGLEEIEGINRNLERLLRYPVRTGVAGGAP
jgi:RpiR family carbohydrate utilization transcriptional regulator